MKKKTKQEKPKVHLNGDDFDKKLVELYIKIFYLAKWRKGLPPGKPAKGSLNARERRLKRLQQNSRDRYRHKTRRGRPLKAVTTLPNLGQFPPL